MGGAIAGLDLDHCLLRAGGDVDRAVLIELLLAGEAAAAAKINERIAEDSNS